MGDLVGEKVFDKYGEEFPILIKYIDSNDYLSVQVHPDDELAMKRHQCYGKTEMWLINQADPDAVLINGFSQQSDKESFLKHLKNKSVNEILRTEPVNNGDVFFIPAGRIHALGSGLLLTEIQQTSDITYRVYDWDRQSNNGIARELHVDLALDAIDFSLQDTVKTTYHEKMNQPVQLANSPYFTTNLLHLNETIDRNYHSIDSFKIYICQEGSFKLKYADHEMIINKSECILVPAVFEYVELHPLNSAKLLEIYID